MNQRQKFESWLRSIWTPGYDCRRGPGGDSYAHREAQNYWVAWQAALAASGGNAAPEVASGTLPELPEHGEMGSMVTKGKVHPKYSAEQMTTYGHACYSLGRGAAVREYIYNGTFKDVAAPNAALVAALKAVLLIERGSSGRIILENDDETAIWAALSAAGQEVGK